MENQKIEVPIYFFVSKSSCQEVVYSRKEKYDMIKNRLMGEFSDLIDNLQLTVSERNGSGAP